MKTKSIMGSILLVIVFFSSIGIVSAWELDPIDPITNPVKKYAVVVGISDYKYDRYDNSNCASNAQEWRNVLLNDFNFDVVTLILNSAATEWNILNAIENVANIADENDYIVFYYSGHGSTKGLCMWDYVWWNKKNINEGELYGDLQYSSCENIFVFLHACNSGIFSDYMDIPSIYNSDNFLVITSCSATETSATTVFGHPDDFLWWWEIKKATYTLEEIWEDRYIYSAIATFNMHPQIFDGDNNWASFFMPYW